MRIIIIIKLYIAYFRFFSLLLFIRWLLDNLIVDYIEYIHLALTLRFKKHTLFIIIHHELQVRLFLRP